MDVLRTVSMFILGIGGIITGILEIKKNAKKPLPIILCCLAISIGTIGYALSSEWLFLIIGLIGFVLMFVLG
jgi:1,4-dihydroxy-2-naphthoate octaprenyltransferase